MAIISTSTFKPLEARCNVRLQQGVPIVDADWNELDDIRRFELRAYLKWFVGDGIPHGSDAFKIETFDPNEPNAIDDFMIHAGAPPRPPNASDYDHAMRFAGRAIVDGLDVIIPQSILYRSQPLFAAAMFGVPKIPPIPPSGNDFAIYLDVWERLVTAQDDPSLVLSGIGTESCARVKREWCVRTRKGKALPQPADPDFIAGHSYCLLATGFVNDEISIDDQRHKGLSLAAMETRLARVEELLIRPSFAARGSQFDPLLGPPGRKVTIFGANLNVGQVTVELHSQAGRFSATLDGIPEQTKIPFKVPQMPSGTATIIVKTAGGEIISSDSFTVTP